jgi:hypothetical protein
LPDSDGFEDSTMKIREREASIRSQAITGLQKEAKLSTKEQLKLIGVFQRDTVAAQTYLDLLEGSFKLRRAWLRSLLKGLS